MDQVMPEVWDGFVFRSNPKDESLEYSMFTELSEMYGTIEKPKSVPHDRDQCQVVLIINRNGAVTVEEPFTAHFTDAFEYAKHLHRSGITGLIFKNYHPQVTVFMEAWVQMLREAFKQKGAK